MFFVIECVLTITFHQFLLKLFDFYNSWLFFSGKIFSTTLLFPILKIKFSVTEIAERILKKKVTIFEDSSLIL